MKHLLFTSAALALALSATTITAETLTPAQQATKDQLADQLDVSPDEYTILELVQMKCIIDGTDDEAERAALLKGIKGYGGPVETASEDKAQLAALLDVDPDEYTIAELSLLKSMVEDDECDVANPAEFVKAGERLSEPAVSAKVQLARALGVSASDYTLAELVEMKLGQEGDN